MHVHVRTSRHKARDGAREQYHISKSLFSINIWQQPQEFRGESRSKREVKNKYIEIQERGKILKSKDKDRS